MLTGSPVAVAINNYTGGSVVVTDTVAFLDNNASSAATYSSVLASSDTSSIFGTNYGSVAVSIDSITSTTAENNSKFRVCSTACQCVAR